MNGDTVAQRYAHALFAIGRDEGIERVEHYGAVLVDFGHMLAASDGLKRLFRAPIISAEEKNGVVQRLLEQMNADKVLRNFFRLLAEKNRLDILPAIVKVFGRLADEAAGIARGTLTTAVPLDEKRRKSVVSSLGKATTSRLKLNFEVDPGILGGIVLRMGDTVMDASLKAQLNVLKENIKRGE